MNEQTKKRFFNKVQKTSRCWLWTASSNRKGYGQFGVKMGRWKIKYAHRMSYEFFVGKIPKGFLVLHKCDVPLCVNPDHLWIGTHMDNCKDKIKKGRMADTKGQKNGRAILSEDEVRRMRKMYLTGKYSQVELGKFFGIKKSMANRVITKVAWKHVS